MEQAPIAAAAVGSLSPVALASVLDQSVDCVKLIGLGGEVQYMNANGLCAMEIDDFRAVHDQLWADLWPVDAQAMIRESLVTSARGTPARFRAFCPTGKGTPRWWDVTVSAVTDAAGAHAGFLSISRDVTESHTSAEALEIAAAEMKHRLKNTYAMIGSLLMSFARGNAHNEAYAAEMADRLIALSRAQALFVEENAAGEIGELIPALVAPFDNPHCPVSAEGEASILVDQPRANAIALVIGELSVNSSKHGAIAHGGAVRVDWATTDGALMIHWHERCERPVERHSRSGGQGLRLMERIMRARGGAIMVDWRDDGLLAGLRFGG